FGARHNCRNRQTPHARWNESRQRARKAPPAGPGNASRGNSAVAARRYCRSVTNGRVLNWCTGGGEVSVHSSVVAPSPHGLAGAGRLRAKASATVTRNSSTPVVEI